MSFRTNTIMPHRGVNSLPSDYVVMGRSMEVIEAGEFDPNGTLLDRTSMGPESFDEGQKKATIERLLETSRALSTEEQMQEYLENQINLLQSHALETELRETLLDPENHVYLYGPTPERLHEFNQTV